MGQGYSLNAPSSGPGAIEASELTDLAFEKVLGGARFLRTIRARHQHGIVVVKICGKPSANFSFKNYARLLKEERQALRDVPNVLPYQKIRETASIGVLVRQFIHSSLYDRVSIRPFLETIEKKWIAFQLLCAVRDCHNRGVYHGDIKSENVLITSWGWVYLTDFASSFKPVYLPEDNPADFTFFYDSSGRRTCYVAPERFLAAGARPLEDKAVQWSMDIFSAGCVIAELFTESPTFTLSQLFRYRKHEYDPTSSLLHKIADEHIRALIGSMIRLDPQERWHAQDYLDEYKGKAFPLYFYQHLHPLMQDITDPSSGRKPVTINESNNGGSDDRIDRLHSDFETLSVSLGYEAPAGGLTAEPRTSFDLFPLELDLPNSRHTASASLPIDRDNGTFILLNIVTSSMRSTARASSAVKACDLLLAFAERLPDEAKLDRILPYLMPLLDNTNEVVLIAALRSITQLLALVTVASPINSFLFTQFVFPRLASFLSSKGFRTNPLVRATYAVCLASLAQTASRFLDMMQALRADGSLPADYHALEEAEEGTASYHDAYDATRIEVLDQLETQTKVFLTDNDTAVRRAFLSSVPVLCVVFGQARASDVLLSHLNTYLNDPEWQLKRAFFRTVVGIAVHMGTATVEEIVLPLMLQALTDPQDFVVEQVLHTLAVMAELGLLQRPVILELIETVARFLVHPNPWVKEAASTFVSAATLHLSPADVRILVSPILKPYLKVPVSSCYQSELLDVLRRPLPRQVFDIALQWAGLTEDSTFWKDAKDSRPQGYAALFYNGARSGDGNVKALNKLRRTDEDEQWLGRLRNAGMLKDDESALLAFRDFLWRAAQRLKRGDASHDAPSYDQLITCTSLRITPQTVIFDNDVQAYNERVRDVRSQLQEATVPSHGTTLSGDAVAEVLDDGVNAGDNKKDGLKLPILHSKDSGSGPNLSTSPASAMDFLGREGSVGRHPSHANSLLAGTELRSKAAAEVATDGFTAAGRLSTPPISSRKTSEQHSFGVDKGARPNIRAANSYSGNDPAVLKLLDNVYVDNFPTDAAKFGPLVQPLKRGPIMSSNSTVGVSGPWQPKGQLVAVLGEHSAKVNRVVVSPDHAFFATASDDGTVLIWDSTRFERNVNHRSRKQFKIKAGTRVTSLCFVDSTHTFVCTGSDGMVYIVKVEVDASDADNGPRYGGSRDLRALGEWRIPRRDVSDEYAVWTEHFRGSDASSTLLMVTNAGRVLAVDLRYMSVLHEFWNPAQHGTPTSFCIGRRHDWMLIGTSHGVLDLWDLRFRVQLRSWAFPQAAPISRVQLHPSRKSTRRHRVCVSGGSGFGEVSVWDIEKIICHDIYRTAQVNDRLGSRMYELRNIDQDRNESNLSRVVGSLTSESPDALANGIVAFFSVYQLTSDLDSQHPFAISGGPDGKVRFWDADRVEGCRLVCGAHTSENPPSYTLTALGLDTRVISEQTSGKLSEPGAVVDSPASPSKRQLGSKLSRYEAIRLSAQQLLEGHLDAITDVAILEKPFGLVLSADRAGQVFVHQ